MPVTMGLPGVNLSERETQRAADIDERVFGILVDRGIRDRFTWNATTDDEGERKIQLVVMSNPPVSLSISAADFGGLTEDELLDRIAHYAG